MAMSKLEEIVKEFKQSRLVTTKAVHTNIYLDDIKVLPQMRKTFDSNDIEVLADNIQIVGLINPIILNKKSKNKKFVLVAGERRLRSHYFLRDTPQRYVTDVLKEYFEKHKIDFSDKKVENVVEKLKKEHEHQFSTIYSSVYNNLTDEQHKALQFAENSYVPVNSGEAAEGYVDQYEYMKREYEKRGKHITKTLFAKIMGKSVSTIDDALKFVDLDPYIKNMVKEGYYDDQIKKNIRLNYGVAILLTKIKDDRIRKEYAETALFRKYDEEKMKEKLKNIFLRQEGQMALFKEPDIVQRKITIINEIGEDVHTAGINSAAYMERVATLSGAGLEMDPLRLDSVKEMLERLNFVSEKMVNYAKRRKKVKDNYTGPRLKVVYHVKDS